MDKNMEEGRKGKDKTNTQPSSLSLLTLCLSLSLPLPSIWKRPFLRHHPNLLRVMKVVIR